jgi:AcrR family transcriptional regulator
MEGRRERKKRQTRDAIAKTALQLFAERGYDEVTVSDVAAAADVAVTTVFNYFKTKEDLFFGAFTPPSDILATRLRARPSEASPVEVVREFLLEALDRMEEWAGVEHQTRIRAALATSPALQMQAAHRFRARRLESLDEVAAALTAPETPDAFAHMVAAQLLALVDGTMREAVRSTHSGEAPAELAGALRSAVERACGVLSKGLEDFGRRSVSSPPPAERSAEPSEDHPPRPPKAPRPPRRRAPITGR